MSQESEKNSISFQVIRLMSLIIAWMIMWAGAAMLSQQKYTVVVTLFFSALFIGLFIFWAKQLRQLIVNASQNVDDYAQRIAESESRFQVIFNQTFQFIGLLSKTGVLIEANQAAISAVGVAHDSVKGKLFWETVWWQHSPELQELLREAITDAAGGKFVRFEVNHAKPDGDIIYVDFSLKPVKNPQGQVIQLIAEGRDVTERKQNEQELEQYRHHLEELVDQRTQELSKSEERMRLFFERQLVGMAITSPEKGWLQVNNKLCQMLGYSKDELIQLDWARLTYPDDLAADVVQFERLLAAEIDEYMLEKRFVRKDGNIVFTNLAVGCVRRPDQSVEYVLALLEDITERKRAEQELKQHTVELLKARDEAESANKAKSTFLANMSHELRTPLNVILGYAQLLEQEELSSELHEEVHAIREAGDHLLMLINNVLDLAKLEAGKVSLDIKIVNIRDFLLLVASLINVKAAEKKLEFEQKIADDLPELIYADQGALRQILLNLLSNAVKFTHMGKISLNAYCLHKNDEVTVKFEVSDTGIGIPQDKLETIFVPFEQAGGQEQQKQGTGLGLTISSQLVKKMGSEINVESVEGQGSRFWFDVSFKYNHEAHDITPTQEWTMPSGYKGPHKQLLIVDDVETNRKVLLSFLQPLGFGVLQAENGLESFEIATSDQLDLIIMDHVMPVMDGIDAIRKLRQHKATQTTPIIMLSANASNADKDIAIEAGANSFLPKPIDVRLLLQEMEALMNLQWQYQK